MFCLLFKLMISHSADTGRPLGRVVQRHTNRCRSCKRFCDSCQLLERDLRAEAVGPTSQYELRTERIMDGLSGRSKRSRYRPVRLRNLAAAACIALATAAVIMFTSKSPVQTPPPEPPISISDLLPTDLEATWAGIVEEPLAVEMKSLADDAESVISFLVGCIDVDPLQNKPTH